MMTGVAEHDDLLSLELWCQILGRRRAETVIAFSVAPYLSNDTFPAGEAAALP
jgi:hypothetical protein